MYVWDETLLVGLLSLIFIYDVFLEKKSFETDITYYQIYNMSI